MKRFKTSDIYLAAYLRSEGKSLLGYEMRRGKVWYSFPDDPVIKAMTWDYEAGTADSCPKSLRDNVRDIKSLVNSGKKVGGAV